MLVGKKAPSFSAQAVINGGEFVKEYSLDQFLGKQPVIFFFYPKDFTFVCPTELFAFQEKLEEFENWKADFLRRYGSTMISRDHNGWNVQNEKFKAEQDGENKRFMTHHRGMEKKLGRKLSY